MIAVRDVWTGVAPRLEPRALARTILSERRFGVRAASPERTVWDRILAWVWDRWNAFFDALSKHVHVSRAGGATIGGFMLGAAVVLVLYFLIRLAFSTVRDARVAGSKSVALTAGPDAQALCEQSDRAAAAGHYALAIALLFRACVKLLDVRGSFGDDRSRTVNECRRMLGTERPEAVSSFDAIARPFTAAVYAERAIELEQWHIAREAYARLSARGELAA